jgi:beta-glucosidase
MRETIAGLQDSNVIATAKHYIMNEQEHYRDFVHANVDDKTMHELYLWLVYLQLHRSQTDNTY